MLSKTLFALAALALQASAFKVPAGATNGIYRAYYDADGAEVYEKISDGSDGHASLEARKAAGAPYSPVYKREVLTWCGCNFSMNIADTDAANSDLANQMGSGTLVPGQGNLFAISNSAVAFFCNEVNTAHSFSSNDVFSFGSAITASCGSYVPGTYMDTVRGRVAFGYMNYSDDLDFCAVATTSPANSC